MMPRLAEPKPLMAGTPPKYQSVERNQLLGVFYNAVHVLRERVDSIARLSELELTRYEISDYITELEKIRGFLIKWGGREPPQILALQDYLRKKLETAESYDHREVDPRGNMSKIIKNANNIARGPEAESNDHKTLNVESTQPLASSASLPSQLHIASPVLSHPSPGFMGYDPRTRFGNNPPPMASRPTTNIHAQRTKFSVATYSEPTHYSQQMPTGYATSGHPIPQSAAGRPPAGYPPGACSVPGYHMAQTPAGPPYPRYNFGATHNLSQASVMHHQPGYNAATYYQPTYDSRVTCNTVNTATPYYPPHGNFAQPAPARTPNAGASTVFWGGVAYVWQDNLSGGDYRKAEYLESGNHETLPGELNDRTIENELKPNKAVQHYEIPMILDEKAIIFDEPKIEHVKPTYTIEPNESNNYAVNKSPTVKRDSQIVLIRETNATKTKRPSLTKHAEPVNDNYFEYFMPSYGDRTNQFGTVIEPAVASPEMRESVKFETFKSNPLMNSTRDGKYSSALTMPTCNSQNVTMLTNSDSRNLNDGDIQNQAEKTEQKPPIALLRDTNVVRKPRQTSGASCRISKVTYQIRNTKYNNVKLRSYKNNNGSRRKTSCYDKLPTKKYIRKRSYNKIPRNRVKRLKIKKRYLVSTRAIKAMKSNGQCPTYQTNNLNIELNPLTNIKVNNIPNQAKNGKTNLLSFFNVVSWFKRSKMIKIKSSNISKESMEPQKIMHCNKGNYSISKYVETDHYILRSPSIFRSFRPPRARLKILN